MAAFAVRLSEAQSLPFEVALHLEAEDGVAVAADDRAWGRLRVLADTANLAAGDVLRVERVAFAPGQTERRFRVRVVDDDDINADTVRRVTATLYEGTSNWEAVPEGWDGLLLRSQAIV